MIHLWMDDSAFKTCHSRIHIVLGLYKDDDDVWWFVMMMMTVHEDAAAANDDDEDEDDDEDDDDDAHLLKVVVQESIEDWVCAAGGDPDQVKHQVNLWFFKCIFKKIKFPQKMQNYTR